MSKPKSEPREQQQSMQLNGDANIMAGRFASQFAVSSSAADASLTFIAIDPLASSEGALVGNVVSRVYLSHSGLRMLSEAIATQLKQLDGGAEDSE